MYKKIIVFFIFILITGVFVFSQFSSKSRTNRKTLTSSENSNSYNTQSEIPKTSIIAKNLDTPWAIAFLPDKSMLVTERPGRVRLVTNSGKLQEKPVAEITNVKEYGEGGLLGIALHPDFSVNHYVYLYYTYSSDKNNTLNRVVRMKYENEKLKNEEIIVDKIPGAIFHDGGRIKFGSDGMLYVTTGDSQNPSFAKNINSLAGKILRVTPDGKTPSDNPFGNLVYSFGHRNPQGIAWDQNGNLWETEHGRSNPGGFDEINLIKKGKNYGWDTIQGDQTKPGLETPKKNSGSSTTWAPSGAAFIKNSLYFAGLKGETLYEGIITGEQVTDLKEHFTNDFGRIREVILGPDNMLYLTTSNQDGRGNPTDSDDLIIRVNPKKL